MRNTRGVRTWLCVCAALVAMPIGVAFAGPLIISEFMAVNDKTLLDEDGDSSDWIEIANVSAQEVDLGGWFLTDNPGDLEKWRFPAVELAPGECLVVFASFKDRAGAGSQLHTNFKLDDEGEFLALVEPDGDTIAYAYAPVYPRQVPDIAYGVEFDGEIFEGAGNGLGYMMAATPGAFNTLNWPRVRDIAHTPREPASGEPIVVSADISHPSGISQAVLQYQTVAPGHFVPAYLPLEHRDLLDQPDRLFDPNPEFHDPVYWTTVSLADEGAGGDAVADDGVFSATIPEQINRTLVRYRIIVTNGKGHTVAMPLATDPALNYACFVYDGVPPYAATKRSVHPDGPGHVYGADVMRSLPVYTLITRPEDLTHCYAYDASLQIPSTNTPARRAFNWEGAFVYDGIVYDHVRYRLRQHNARYQGAGKRAMRIRFNQGHHLRARNNRGEEYPVPWRTLDTSKLFSNLSVGNFGLVESVNSQLWNLLGVPTPWTHFFHFRVLDGEEEAPEDENGQYFGDFYGLYLALEDYDTEFIEAHELQDGNLYKLKDGVLDGNELKRHQGFYSVRDDSDFRNILNNLRYTQPEEWLRTYVNYDKFYRYWAMVEAIRHYDFDLNMLKNRAWYFEPHPSNPFGQLWVLPHDHDDTWGPHWDATTNYPKEAIFANGGKPEFLVEYRSAVREFRDLLWTEEAIHPMIDDLAAIVAPFTMADRDRWKDAPAAAGYGDYLPAPIEAKVQDMKNFAFVAWSGAGGTPVPAGGRAAALDEIAQGGDDAVSIPYTPEIVKWQPEATTLVAQGADASILVPTDALLGRAWTEPDFVESSEWVTTATGIGFKIADAGAAGDLLVDLNSADLSSGTVSHWKNRGMLGDFRAYGTNPILGIVAGAKAVLFDGESALLRTAEVAPPAITGNDDWSVEVWAFNPEVADRETLVNWAQSSGPPASAASLNYGSSRDFGAVEHWGSADRPYAGGPPTSGTWHHIVATYSGGTKGLERIYVDGALNTSQTRTLNLHGQNDDRFLPIILGAASDNQGAYDPKNHFSGALGAVRIHSAELLPEFAETNYMASARHFGKTIPEGYRADSPLAPADVESRMRGVNASIYLRIPFQVSDPAQYRSLSLKVHYNDGFVAYLNGVEVARRNAPDALAWDASATAERLGHLATTPEIIPLSIGQEAALRPGENVLAIHALNFSADDIDFRILPELLASEEPLSPPTEFLLDSLVFAASPFRDPQGDETFSAMQWRVGEITDPACPAYDPSAPRLYEIAAVWESGEIEEFQETVRIPEKALESGHTYRARVRMRDATKRWSHWSEPLSFTSRHSNAHAALLAHLRISEIMYNPAGGNDYEFIELCNTSTDATLDLSGVSFTNGIDFTFPDGASLAPRACLLLVRGDSAGNFADFRRHYALDESVALFGPYDGKLDNAGETLTLRTAPDGTIILKFTYNDAGGWPTQADGDGSSLEPLSLDATAPEAYGDPANWVASPRFGGSPGRFTFGRESSARWVLY